MGGTIIEATRSGAKRIRPPRDPVLVFPSRGRQHPSLFKTAETDKNGSFTIYGLAPGEYRALAWDNALPPLYRDPSFLAGLVQRASTFTIQADATTTTDVRVIPVP